MEAEPSRRAPPAVPRVEVIGITGIPEIRAGDDLASIIARAAERQATPIESGDVWPSPRRSSPRPRAALST